MASKAKAQPILLVREVLCTPSEVPIAISRKTAADLALLVDEFREQGHLTTVAHLADELLCAAIAESARAPRRS